MDLSEFLENEEKEENELMLVEGQLVIAQNFQKKLIELENQKKVIKNQAEEVEKKIKEIMRENGITGYESNDKLLKISLSEDTVSESVDKDKLFKEYPDAYRACIKETQKKGKLTITIRETNY